VTAASALSTTCLQLRAWPILRTGLRPVQLFLVMIVSIIIWQRISVFRHNNETSEQNVDPWKGSLYVTYYTAIRRLQFLSVYKWHVDKKRCVFRSPPQKRMKIDPHYRRRKCRPLTLVSGNIRFMRIFAGVLWRGGVKRQWSYRKRRFSGIWDATSSAP